MCKKIVCEKCKKPTWTGCGLHIEKTLADVKPEERCKCNVKTKKDN